MTTVTAAVVVKDRRDLMARCLEGLFAQERLPDEIVVVDNESTDGTWELLQERAAAAPVPLRVLREPGSVGHVRNVALAEATGDVISYVDSDCVPAPEWLAQGLKALLADDRVAVVQGRTVPDPDAPRAPWPATQDIPSLSGLYEACNIFYRADVLRRAGGFDETIGFFGEDAMAGWAVLRLGYRPVFEPSAIVAHAVSYPGIGWHLRRATLYWKWARLVRRFPEMRSILWLGVFLRPRTALVFATGVSLVLSPWKPRAALFAVPYLWWRRPRHLRRRAVAQAAATVAFDATVSGALVVGTIRERTVVL